MTSRISHTGKIIVKTSTMITGRGVQFRGISSNGKNSFLLTDAAYNKIASMCKWEN